MNTVIAARRLTLPLHREKTFPSVSKPTGFVMSGRAAREEILHRAHAIWEREGRPQNRKLDNWLEAEADVLRGN